MITVSETGIDFQVLDGDAANYEQAIRLCTDCLYEEGYIKESFFDACLEREQKFPTGLPLRLGVAIPHADSIHVKKSCLCMLRLAKPVEFCRIDDPKEKVNVSFVVCIAIATPNKHNIVLAQLIKAFQDETFILGLGDKKPDEALTLFKARVAV